jgi:hypothetical protein
MRDKWDTRRGDSTYGALTIAKAIANCRETYSAAVTNRTVSGEQRAAEIPAVAHEWSVERSEAFAFPGCGALHAAGVAARSRCWQFS